MTFPTWSLFLFPILAIILITMFPRFKHLLLLIDRQERGRRILVTPRQPSDCANREFPPRVFLALACLICASR